MCMTDTHTQTQRGEKTKNGGYGSTPKIVRLKSVYDVCVCVIIIMHVCVYVCFGVCACMFVSVLWVCVCV